MSITRKAGSIVGAFVMVRGESCTVESVDDVGALEVLLPKMVSTVSGFLIFTDLVQWLVRHVAWVSLPQGVSTGSASRLEGSGVLIRVAGSSRAALIQGFEKVRAVVGGEVLTAWASRRGRRGVVIPPTALPTGLLM